MPALGPRDVARWTFAAFQANPSADDDALVAMLRRAGVPGARRAVALVPLACGRRTLPRPVPLPAGYREVDDAGTVIREAKLADDPVFAAATQLAGTEYSQAVLEAIGRRSPEVRALASAERSGQDPTRITLPPPTVPAAPDAEPDAAKRDAQNVINMLVDRHGAAESIGIHARVYPVAIADGLVALQLDIQTRIDDRQLIEAFMGHGPTIDAAVGEALTCFARGSFFVLLDVLVDHALGHGHVRWETWGEFDVCHGQLQRQLSDEPPVDFAAYLDAIKTAWLATSPEHDTHWLSTSVAREGPRMINGMFHILLDGQRWPEGTSIAAAWPWPAAAPRQTYALRHFCMLVPRPRVIEEIPPDAPSPLIN